MTKDDLIKLVLELDENDLKYINPITSLNLLNILKFNNIHSIGDVDNIDFGYIDIDRNNIYIEVNDIDKIEITWGEDSMSINYNK